MFLHASLRTVTENKYSFFLSSISFFLLDGMQTSVLPLTYARKRNKMKHKLLLLCSFTFVLGKIRPSFFSFSENVVAWKFRTCNNERPTLTYPKIIPTRLAYLISRKCVQMIFGNDTSTSYSSCLTIPRHLPIFPGIFQYELLMVLT